MNHPIHRRDAGATRMPVLHGVLKQFLSTVCPWLAFLAPLVYLSDFQTYPVEAAVAVCSDKKVQTAANGRKLAWFSWSLFGASQNCGTGFLACLDRLESRSHIGKPVPHWKAATLAVLPWATHHAVLLSVPGGRSCQLSVVGCQQAQRVGPR